MIIRQLSIKQLSRSLKRDFYKHSVDKLSKKYKFYFSENQMIFRYLFFNLQYIYFADTTFV